MGLLLMKKLLLLPVVFCSVSTLSMTSSSSSSMSRVGLRASRNSVRMSAEFDAVVVGAGPGGLAAAISLKKQGYSTVVLERGGSSSFVVSRAYTYLVDSRGQRWTEAASLTEKVKAAGVLNDKYATFKAWPDERGLVELKNALLTPGTAKSIWLPRNVLVDVMTEAALEAGVVILYESGVTAPFEEEEGRLVVKAGKRTLRPRVLVGADGLNSTVRNELSRRFDGFEPVELDSPSVGLYYKILALPKSFRIVDLKTNATIETEPSSLYVIPSVLKDPAEAVRLGLLPNADPSLPRTANIIKPKDHEVWKLKDAAEVQNFIKRSFPQVDLKISDEEAALFASSKPGTFPKSRFVRNVAAEWAGTSCFLVGDAAHAFPPDLGQGVNSALEDALCLETQLSDQNLTAAVLGYQELRGPAAEALARCVQVGFPYQYDNCKPWVKSLFFAKFLVRLSLSKLTRGLLARPVAVAVVDGEDYAATWKKASRTTFVYKIFGCVAAAKLAFSLPIVGYAGSFFQAALGWVLGTWLGAHGQHYEQETTPATA